MSKEEEVVLICIREDGEEPPAPSKLDLCAKCGFPIWTSFESLEHVAASSPKARVRLLCAVCGLPLLAEPDAELMPPPPGWRPPWE